MKNEYVMECEQIDGWTFDEKRNGIVKTFSFKGYNKTISFVNSIAWIANKLNHHPDLFVTFKTCEVFYTTHDEHKVTQKDVDCVKRIENLFS